jgi:hypothetical protein
MFPGFRGVRSLTSCHFQRVRVHLLELNWGEHPEGAVSALAIVEDLQVLEDHVRQLDSVRHRRLLSSSTCIRAQNDSTPVLSKQSPMEPIEGSSPERLARSVKAQDVNWVPWSEWISVPAGWRLWMAMPRALVAREAEGRGIDGPPNHPA